MRNGFYHHGERLSEKADELLRKLDKVGHDED
jgi:hypothetical protein